MLPPRIDQGRVAGDAGDGGRAEAGDERPGHREVVDKPGRLLRGPAGQKPLVAAAVIGEVVRHRADEGIAIGTAGVEREELADIDSGDVRPDRPEGPADLRRGVGFHVVGFEVGRAPREPDEDHRRVVRGRLAGVGPGLTVAEEIGQPKASQAEEAGGDRHAAGDGRPHPVTKRGKAAGAEGGRARTGDCRRGAGRRHVGNGSRGNRPGSRVYHRIPPQRF